MAKKTKKQPVKTPVKPNPRIAEVERLMYMIQLMASAISPSDFSTDDILREQIQKLKLRIAEVEAREMGVMNYP